jgi:hypothetical protein
LPFFDFVLVTTVKELQAHKETIEAYGADVSSNLGNSPGYGFDPSGREQVATYIHKFVQDLICHLSDISGHPEIPEDLQVTTEVREVISQAAELLDLGNNQFRRRD